MIRVSGHELVGHHGCGLVIGGNMSISNRARIYQNATIDVKTDGPDNRQPFINQDVSISISEKVATSIQRRDTPAIGPNSVVSDDVPVGAKVFGAPTQVIPSQIHTRVPSIP